ncbi:MAG: SMC-Scp complex subunit ScpB [Mariprofundaceae bacterium]
MKLEHRIEALLLAADEPLSVERLRSLLGEVGAADIHTAIAELDAHYADRGIRLTRAAGGWQLRTAPECRDQVHLLWRTRPPKLSRSMLETLAIIAYRQPVTRAEIEDLRGVGLSSTMLAGLQERGWVKVLGRKEVPGRPHLYGTGKAFLVDFGLNSLSDLPEMAQLMDEEEPFTNNEQANTQTEQQETAQAPEETEQACQQG